MPQPRSRPGFAQKTKPPRFITEILFADDLQRHRASEIDVERLVSDPHRTATQLDRSTVFARHQLVVLKSSRWLNRIFRNRRLAGNNPASKTLTEHADRAEFDCSRKLVTAARAGALGLRFHRPTPLASMRLRKHGFRRQSLLDLASCGKRIFKPKIPTH